MIINLLMQYLKFGHGSSYKQRSSERFRLYKSEKFTNEFELS